jgi:hypothetical protein
MDRLVHPVPVMAGDGRAHRRVDFGHPVQHVAFELRQVFGGDDFGWGKSIERAEQPAHGVAQPAIGFGLLLEDFRPYSHVFADIGGHHPKPENIGTELVVDLLRGDDVAERFRHFTALLIHHEAVGQDGFEGRPAAGANRFKQR